MCFAGATMQQVAELRPFLKTLQKFGGPSRLRVGLGIRVLSCEVAEYTAGADLSIIVVRRSKHSETQLMLAQVKTMHVLCS